MRVCRRAYERGLVSGTSGNASARLGRKVILTPTGSSLGDLKAGDLVTADLSGKIRGGKSPTGEFEMHLAIYRARGDISAILHSHPPHAALFALRGEQIPLITPELQFRIGSVAMVEFAQPGSKELAQRVAEKLHRGSAALLERHGLVTLGKTPAEALYVAEAIEDAARLAHLTRVWSLRC